MPSLLVWDSVLNQKSPQGINLAVAGLDGHGKLRLHDVSGALPWTLGEGRKGQGQGQGQMRRNPPALDEDVEVHRCRAVLRYLHLSVYLTFLGFLPL